MRLFDPLALLWLLLPVPAIIALYLLKLRRRPVTVSSVLLWSAVLKDAQANAPFQKLRRNLLLLLQLLIVGLTVFALSRPFVRTTAPGGRNVVLILDGSASMQSRDAGGTRFEAARAAALRMVDAMQPGDALLPLLVTSRPERLAAFTTDRAALRRALRGARPRDTTTSLAEAVRMAGSLAPPDGTRVGTTITVLSDGAFPDLEEIDTRGAEVQFVRFGSRSENVGIVAFDVRRAASGAGTAQAFLALRNYSTARKAGSVELYRDDTLVDARPYDLPPASPERGFAEQALILEELPASANAGGGDLLRARLDQEDDLATDNEAYAQLAADRATRVLLVTAGNVFLEKALGLSPGVRLDLVAPAAYRGQPGYDVVVFDAHSPAEVGPGNFLYLDAGGPTCPAEPQRRVEGTSVTDWNRAHPVLRYVNLHGLELADAWKARTLPWGQELASDAEGAVLVAGEREEMAVGDRRLTFKSLYAGFSLLRSGFWQRVGFPIFIRNAVQWLAARPGREESQRLRTGETAEIPVPPAASEVTVVDPSGGRHAVPADGPVALFRGTEQVGVYRVEGPGGGGPAGGAHDGVGSRSRSESRFAASLLSREESATRPRDKLQFGRRPVVAAGPARPANRELWRWFALIALAILALEWYAYHRRV